MSNERTFAIIKPNAVLAGRVGQILSEIERSGLSLRGMRLARLTPEVCKEFYQEHVGKPFYPALEGFMVEGPVVLLCLEGENAILRWRDLMGATDPAKAAPGKKTAAKKVVVTKAPAKKAAVKNAAVKKAPAKKVASSTTPPANTAKKAPARATAHKPATAPAKPGTAAAGTAKKTAGTLAGAGKKGAATAKKGLL